MKKNGKHKQFCMCGVFLMCVCIVIDFLIFYLITHTHTYLLTAWHDFRIKSASYIRLRFRVKKTWVRPKVPCGTFEVKGCVFSGGWASDCGERGGLGCDTIEQQVSWSSNMHGNQAPDTRASRDGPKSRNLPPVSVVGVSWCNRS